MSELEDPKTPNTDELLTLLLVQLMRLYDVEMHLLTHFEPSVAKELLAIHEKLEHWSPLPFVVGE